MYPTAHPIKKLCTYVYIPTKTHAEHMSLVKIDGVRVPEEDYKKLRRLEEERAVPLRTLIRSLLRRQLSEIVIEHQTAQENTTEFSEEVQEDGQRH